MPVAKTLFAAKETKVPDHLDGTPVSNAYQCFREPVVVQTRKGRIVVCCQAGNKLEWPERSGQDLVIRYSDDAGIHWSSPVLIAEHGNFSVQSHGMVYDASIDRLIVKYIVYRWDYTKAHGRGHEASLPAIMEMQAKGEAFARQYMVFSDNGGETWSTPLVIPLDNNEDLPHYGSSEGRQLTGKEYAGRLILPGGIRREYMGKVIRKKIGVWYSEDHGLNWNFVKIAEGEPRKFSCEARVTELSDGSLLYNVRTRNDGRLLAQSTDGGKTWSELKIQPDLKVTPCNGSMITLKDSKGKLTSSKLFSIPSPGGRKDGWIYFSIDNGKNWTASQVVVNGFFAYSALIQVNPDTVILFYESNHYRDIKYRRIPISELLAKK